MTPEQRHEESNLSNIYSTEVFLSYEKSVAAMKRNGLIGKSEGPVGIEFFESDERKDLEERFIKRISPLLKFIVKTTGYAVERHDGGNRLHFDQRRGMWDPEARDLEKILMPKTRTMNENKGDNESNQFKVASKHDPRVTPIGRLLRMTSLDEVPQLLDDSFSLVGKRPFPDKDLYGEIFEEVVGGELAAMEYRKNTYGVTPNGVTGWTQVTGARTIDEPGAYARVAGGLEAQKEHFSKEVWQFVVAKTLPVLALAREIS